MNESPETLPRPTVGVLRTPSPEDVVQIVALERDTFNWEVSEEDMSDLADTVQNPDSVVGVIRGGDDKIVGYIIAIPATAADESIRDNDPDYEPSDEDLYIETFAIAPKYRLLNTAELIQAMAAEAVQRGYTKIVGHVPEEHTRLYVTFGAQALRTMNNWYDSGEPHVYIEYPLNASS